MAKTRPHSVMADSHIMNGMTRKYELVATTSTSPKTRSGTRPVQNFAHHTRRSGSGAAFEAERRKDEARGDRGDDEARQGEVEKGDHVLEVERDQRAALQRQDAEVVHVHHHQGEQEVELRPLA